MNRADELPNRNLHGGRFGSNSQARLTVPQSRIARILSRFLFFIVLVVLIPYIRLIFKQQGQIELRTAGITHSSAKEQFSDLIFQLQNNGILYRKQRNLALIAGPIDVALFDYALLLRSIGADIVIDNSNLWRKGSLMNESVDTVFVLNEVDAGFVDRVLRSGGSVVLPVINLSSNVFIDRFNYRCAYIKPYNFESFVLALVKPSLPMY